MKYLCRINNNHQFTNKEDKLAHEKICEDLPKSKYKICIYYSNHIISKNIYEKHLNSCKYKPEKIIIEKKSENIDNITKNENINQKIINEEENNINNNEKKNEIKKEIENNIYDEEDRIFWEAYKN